MTITLYKGVELRSDYSVIFDCDQDFWSEESGFRTPFARYLAEKQSVVRDIENTYFTNDGVLSIDWTVFDGDYEGFTYMSVLLDTGETKYFFIDSYEYLNEMLRINYSIDVWHTYSAKMKIYNGIIGRANRELDGLRKGLPIAYQTNDPLNFVPFDDNNNEFYIIAEFSVFNLNSLQDTTKTEAIDRFSYTSLVARHNYDYKTTSTQHIFQAEQSVASDVSYTYTQEQAIETINKLTAYQGVKPLGERKTAAAWFSAGSASNYTKQVRNSIDIYSQDLSNSDIDPDNLRYELIQVFCVPKTLFFLGSTFYINHYQPINLSLLMLDSADVGLQVAGSDPEINYHFNEYQFLQVKEDTNGLFTRIRYIDAKPTTVGFGTKSLFIPFEYNGLTRTIEQRIFISNLGFSAHIVTDGGYIDLTDQFAVALPFTAPSATEKQLEVLARQQAKAQAIASAASLGATALGAVGGLASGGVGIYNAIQAATVGNVVSTTTPIVGGRNNTLLTSATTQKLNQIPWNQAVSPVVSGAQTIMSGALGFAYGATNLINATNKLKQPVNAGTANNTSPDPMINAIYGFGTYEITPNNETEVNTMIDLIGYNVFIKDNDYRHGQSDFILYGQHEPIQFATAQVTGPFGNDVRAALEAILLEGAIISYSPYIFDNL